MVSAQVHKHVPETADTEDMQQMAATGAHGMA